MSSGEIKSVEDRVGSLGVADPGVMRARGRLDTGNKRVGESPLRNSTDTIVHLTLILPTVGNGVQSNSDYPL